MRPRKRIEESADCSLEVGLAELQLEVLLDIRDLLLERFK
jgi:hypothetical protein